ncbi:MAG: zinc ribbon domain-containing protein [Anaerolineae bacterium]|jgi:hypothetical protein
MKRLLLTLFCLLTLMGDSRAQETHTLSSVEIALWPEYDRPEMLVIYSGLFASDSSLPSPVEIRIPASVGQPAAVAYIGEGGQLLNQPYDTRAEGDSLVISFEPSTAGFHVEYYAPLPVDETGQRSFTYEYTADYPLTTLGLEVQAPPTAEDFVLEPAAESVFQKSDGLTYHQVTAGPMAQGEARSWVIAYQRSGSELTIESVATAEAPAEPQAVAGGDEDGSAVLIFAVAFVALVAVGASAFWLGKHTQSAAEAPSRPRRKSNRSERRSDREKALFCHLCGAQLRSDSEFCHKCGAAVRKT